MTFLGSAALLFGLPRLAIEASGGEKKAPTSVSHGLTAMIKRAPLRKSLFLAFLTSIGGAFVIVATVDFVKSDLCMSDSAYAWVMASFGVGSAVAALLYSKFSQKRRMARSPIQGKRCRQGHHRPHGIRRQRMKDL